MIVVRVLADFSRSLETRSMDASLSAERRFDGIDAPGKCSDA
jgi:hypothetical protein